MNKPTKSSSWPSYLMFIGLVGGFIFISGCSLTNYEGLSAFEWADKYDELRREALYKISDANKQIENVQSFAGEPYEDMEQALLSIEKIDESFIH